MSVSEEKQLTWR